MSEEYMGKWYLITRIPQWYDQDCNNQTAEYFSLKNGNILILNACYEDGVIKRYSVGEARNLGDNKFFVSFSGFQEPEVANYIIIETDYNSYSLVGSEDKEGLWVLSRTKDLPRKDYLIQKAKGLGYDVTRLVDTSRGEHQNESCIIL